MSATDEAVAVQESDGRFVRTERFRMHYYDVGSGHPIVLLHGSGPGATAWANFRPNIEPLSRTHRVIAVDMPGWGESDPQTAETGRDHVQFLIDFLDEIGVTGPAALVGNSMGGMTSIAAAIRFPERVSHLITMGAPCPGVNIFVIEPSEGMKILLACYAEPTAANFKQLVQIMSLDPALASDELVQMRADAASAHPEHLRNFLDSMSGPPDPSSSMFQFFTTLAPRVREIVAPTMAMHGRDDRVVPYENSLRLVSQVQNSRMVLFNRCGHWAQIEHADEFNRLVASFVGSGDGP